MQGEKNILQKATLGDQYLILGCISRAETMRLECKNKNLGSLEG
jgi:hypothetical protein